MLEKLRTFFSESSISRPRSLTFAKLLPLILLALGMTVLSMMYLRHQDAQYKPLYGAQEKLGAADVMSVLEAEKIAYRIHPETGQVLVAQDMVGRARMVLAAKGVVAKLQPGLEQVDKNDPLGVNQFVQDVRFRRGLESELAQSIATLEAVESARVHLSVAKSSSFILSDGEKSSASVLLVLKRGQKLRKEQVAAIMSLVAGSVPNLEPDKVSVLDQGGNFLSAMAQAQDSMPTDSDATQRLREDALRSIQDLLTPVLGEGNFKASVTLDLDSDQVSEMRERYGDAPHVMQEAVREENESTQAPLGVPGSLSNRAAPSQNETAPKDTATKDKASNASLRPMRNATTRQYAYDRSVVEIKRKNSRIRRMSVAVVLNNAAAPVAKSDAGTGASGWSTEQLKNIETLLSTGLGIDRKREDQLVVSALDFSPVSAPPAEADLAWWQKPEHYGPLAQYAAYALGALLLLFMVIRPSLKLAREWTQAQIQGQIQGQTHPHPQAQRLSSSAVSAQNPSPYAQGLGFDPAQKNQGVAAPLGMAALSAPERARTIDLPPVGSDVDVLIEHLRTLTLQNPERVVDVIKPWIQKNGKTD